MVFLLVFKITVREKTVIIDTIIINQTALNLLKSLKYKYLINVVDNISCN